jgi:hypothetical protein
LNLFPSTYSISVINMHLKKIWNYENYHPTQRDVNKSEDVHLHGLNEIANNLGISMKFISLCCDKKSSKLVSRVRVWQLINQLSFCLRHLSPIITISCFIKSFYKISTHFFHPKNSRSIWEFCRFFYVIGDETFSV